jgi:hypothetical protein
VISNAPKILSNHASNPTEVSQTEATSRHKSRGTKSEATHGDEWVEQDEPGVYITLVSLPTGVKDLKRVGFRHVSFPNYFIHPNLKNSLKLYFMFVCLLYRAACHELRSVQYITTRL